MRFGQGSHTRNPWWCWAAMTVAAAATLSGAPLLVDAEEGNAPRRQAYSETVILPAYNELVAAEDWRARSEASKRLVEFGEAALPFLLEGSEHQNKEVREYCFRILYDHFLTDRRSYNSFIRGLRDTDERISYSCAFGLGKVGNEDAESALREAMEQASGDLVRYAAAKSLAELGNEDVIVTLYYGLGNDRYFPRHLCNLGIKALTGRDLNDFGYNYSEGAHLSGVELVGAGHPIHDAEKKASRFRAIAEYCRWLRDEKPDIYARLDPDEDRIAPPTNPWSSQNGHDNQPGQQ